MDISFLLRRRVDSALAGLEEAKNPAGKVLRLIQIFLTPTSFEKISPVRQTNSPQTANHRFEFQKRRQLFIRTHNEALTVAMRANNRADVEPWRHPITISTGQGGYYSRLSQAR